MFCTSFEAVNIYLTLLPLVSLIIRFTRLSYQNLDFLLAGLTTFHPNRFQLDSSLWRFMATITMVRLSRRRQSYNCLGFILAQTLLSSQKV